MSTLVIHFEDNDKDVWSGRNLDIDMWKTACFNWGIDELRIIDLRTDKTWQPLDPSLQLKWYSTIEEATEDLNNIVYIDRQGDTSLWQINHNEIEAYVIGASYGYISRPEGVKVVIPQQGRDEMHSTHIAAIVLADRYGNLLD